MRAHEFITEGVDGNANISKRKRYATRGLNLFADGEKWNTDYTLNRIMMAAACTDGTFMPDIDTKSWVGKHKTAHPYTQEESDMLKKAWIIKTNLIFNWPLNKQKRKILYSKLKIYLLMAHM